jgi:hypothetical protein
MKMPNIVIMVHNAMSEMLLNGTFSRIPNAQVINIPTNLSSRSLEQQIEFLKITLKEKGLTYADIDFFLVESNYGTPASKEINIPLFNFVLDAFINARIIAYSNTTLSLVNAMTLHAKIHVMNSDHNLEAEINHLLQQLPNHALPSLSSRIFSLKTLKEEILFHDRPSTARERSNTGTAIPTHEGDFTHPRRNTLPLLTLYSTNNHPFPSVEKSDPNVAESTSPAFRLASLEKNKP